jgi:hypothetical protein
LVVLFNKGGKVIDEVKTGVGMVEAAASEERNLLGVRGVSACPAAFLTNLVGADDDEVAAIAAQEFHAGPSTEIVRE